MALTSKTGGLYPGANARSVYGTGNTGAELHTVPDGRILYVSDSEHVKLKGYDTLPIDHRGGLSTDYNHKPFWVTGGFTVVASNNGAIMIGVEFDA